jgi:hypothetical protein
MTDGYGGGCAMPHCDGDGAVPRLSERDGEVYRFCSRHDPLAADSNREWLYTEVTDAQE